ncbi:MAG TPA: hypothetical protein VEZ42_00345 [Pseudonocardia sp.]|nr:hypothetical protein [Pseudonocardia sp.]
MQPDTTPGPRPTPPAPAAPATPTVDPVDPVERSVAAVLARQDGLITREQAVTAGLPATAVDERVRLRRWRPLQPRVYLARGDADDPATRLRAALLWAGPRAVLAGPAAAWWHGLLDRPPAAASVILAAGAGRRGRARAGVAVHRRDLDPTDVTVLGGIAVTALPLTVLDAAVALGAGGPAFLDRALRERVRFPAVLAALRRTGGSPGAARAAALLDAAADRSAAATADAMVRLLRGAGARPEPERRPIDPAQRAATPAGSVERPGPGSGAIELPDRPFGAPARIALPAARLLIELTGWARPVDPARPAPPPGPDWTVLRYTWHDLVDRPELVLTAIAGAAARRGAPTVISATCRGHAGHLGEQAGSAPGYPKT